MKTAENLKHETKTDANEPSETNTDGGADEIDGVTRRRSAPLLAKRRQRLEPSVDDEDDEVNHSKLFVATPSTTSNLEVLQIEAQLLANGTELDDVHIPANDAVLETAEDVLADEGLTPAWEVVGE